jgi:hypothetical protein
MPATKEAPTAEEVPAARSTPAEEEAFAAGKMPVEEETPTAGKMLVEEEEPTTGKMLIEEEEPAAGKMDTREEEEEASAGQAEATVFPSPEAPTMGDGGGLMPALRIPKQTQCPRGAQGSAPQADQHQVPHKAPQQTSASPAG